MSLQLGLGHNKHLVRFRPQVHTVWSRPHQHIRSEQKHLGGFKKSPPCKLPPCMIYMRLNTPSCFSGFENTKAIFLPKLLLIFPWRFARVSYNPAISNMWHQSDKQKPRVDFSTHTPVNESVFNGACVSIPLRLVQYLPEVFALGGYSSQCVHTGSCMEKPASQPDVRGSWAVVSGEGRNSPWKM